MLAAAWKKYLSSVHLSIVCFSPPKMRLRGDAEATLHCGGHVAAKGNMRVITPARRRQLFLPAPYGGT
jgi:hypothetical protein